MNLENFKDLILTKNISQIHHSELNALLAEFPYFDILNLIKILQIKQTDPERFTETLSRTAIYFSDKKRLYDLLNTDLRNKIIQDYAKENIRILDHSESTELKKDNESEDLLDFSYSAPQKKEIIGIEEGPSLAGDEKGISQSDSYTKISLIDRFLIEDPGPIRADKKTSLIGDVSKASVIESENLLTDTLAKIYVKQGLFNKAIYAYEKLSLKYPEKSVYFASQIKEIKEIINKK